MPTVLNSNDRADVVSALASPPTFTQPQVLALYGWVSRLVTALFNYISFFLGDNAEQTVFLENCVQDLEEKLKELQSKPAVPLTIPHSTPQQPLHPTKLIRCKRCSALGHDTNDCRSKDPIAIKKQVTNNQKARKRSMMQDHPIPGPAMPPSTSSVYFRPDGSTTDAFGSPLYFNPCTSTYQAFTALAADTKELRRRKMQSMWDWRRWGATSTTA